MKNLRVSYENAVTDEKTIALLTDAVRMCVDTYDELLFVVLRDGRIIAIDRNMTLVDEFGQSTPKLSGDGPSEVVGFDYLDSDQQICLVLADGSLLIFSINNKEFNCVMELKRRVVGYSWSRDQFLLVIATDSHLLLISREFHVVAEAPIRPTTTGKDQLLTIGWGSTETQFQGSTGKQNVRKHDQHRMPISIREDFDDKKVLISWRSDSQFFAVSSVDEVLVPKQTPADSPSKNNQLDKILCRQIRVWNRELGFMSQCEFLGGIEPALCNWSERNLIAVPSVLSNDRHVWFYERNGQIRNKLKLCSNRFSTLDPDCVDGAQLDKCSVVRHLASNLACSILMLCYEDLLLKSFQLQFWTASNYSWAEKVRFSVGALTDLFWDSEDPNKFHYLTKSGVYHKIVFRFEYNCEDMIVVSVNGDRVRVTDFKYAPIPPPMCHYELCLDYVGTPSAFAQSSVFGLAFVSSDFTRISTFSLQNRRFVRSKRVAFDQRLRMLLNLTWRDANTLLAFRKSERSGGAYELVELRLNPLTISPLDAFDHLPLAPLFLSNFTDNQLFDWNSEMGNYVQIEPFKLSDDKCLLALSRIKTAAPFGYDGLSAKTIEIDAKCVLVFYLNSNRELFVNGKLLRSKVLSFCCTNDFLALITFHNSYRLFCLPIPLVEKFTTDGDNRMIIDTFEGVGAGREVERGAELIANEPNGTRVWLQMPRGNLEVIHPRPILIEKLKCWLNARQWSKTFAEMRRHRINLNLLYDHNPKAFLDNVGQFVTQVNDSESLCVFLTSLEAVDTTQQVFAQFYPEHQPTNPHNKQQRTTMEATGKVNAICDRIRAHVMSLSEADGERDHFLRLYPVVLCCYVREKPSRISAALANMCTQIAKVDKTGEEHSDLVRQWTKHLSNLINENDLFKQALKTYDIEIALMVAQATNLDPKEYLPTLNQLKHKTPATYQKFHVDLHLEEWNSALEHISALALQQQQEEEEEEEEEKEKEDDVANNVEKEEKEDDVANNVGKEEKEDDQQKSGTTQTKCSYLEECIELVQERKLYSAALKLFCGTPHYKKICNVTAMELEKKGRLREAAIFFEKANDLPSAIRCHLNVPNFFEYRRLTNLQKQSDTQTESELHKMAKQLVFKNDHLTAAEVFMHLGKEDNSERVLECYEKANCWSKLVVFVNENQYADAAVNQGIVNRAQVFLSTRCAQIIEQIDGWRDTLTKHTKRLEVLREEKRNNIEAMATAKQTETGDDDKGDDVQSWSSSSAVTSSSFSDSGSQTTHGDTGTTTSNRYTTSFDNKQEVIAKFRERRLERTKQIIKEGSPYEDGAILLALKGIYQRIDTQQDELVELLPALLSMDLVERACRLQNEMLTFLKFITENHARVWPSYLEAFHLSGPLNQLYRGSQPSDPMPRKIQLNDELIPPKLRSTGVEWKMEIIK